ncbi:arylalcohol dehydrogenase [Moniliophthora roreri MCA 2997]|uniref:Arylalcohol dehydrogenase n=1 Tax=Moniliophthora roreri (strain MCA 2997) TaxID=1381753 RepID=V2WLF5_MONRO|nr:arylalcohol dehydrogenase [Moniliophthora roreri MCA 2997]
MQSAVPRAIPIEEDSDKYIVECSQMLGEQLVEGFDRRYIRVVEGRGRNHATYIDLLYAHWWNWDTSVKEVMDRQSRHLEYTGLDHREYEPANGTSYSGFFEWEFIPMARHLGMAIAPFGVLAGGKLRTVAEEQRRLELGEEGRKTLEYHFCGYCIHDAKTTHVFPIIEGRKVEHLQQNLEALTAERIKFLESQVEFDVGFPTSMIGDGSDIFIGLKMAGTYQRIPYPKPLGKLEFTINIEGGNE